MTGAELIAAERERQITDEGWTPEHDNEHINYQLVLAAQSYLGAAINVGFGASDINAVPPQSFPWDASWWKPSDDQVRNLVKAGALIAAEIDRIGDRK